MTKKADDKGKKPASKKAGSSNGNGSSARAGRGRERPTTVSGTLTLLAENRAKFPALQAAETAQFMGQHTAEACRTRGKETKARDIFRIGITWALTLGQHADDAGFNPILSRWFLDCLTALGEQLEGRASSSIPSVVGASDDTKRAADALLASTKRRVTSAAGTNKAWREAVAKALAAENALDPQISQLEGLAVLLEGWLKTDVYPPLAAHRLTADTAVELRAAVSGLHQLNASRKAPLQQNRDTPAINELEGRTLFAMRPIWDELAAAREEGTSSVQLYVSRSLLRGMDLKVKAKRGGATEENEEGVIDEEDISEDEEDEEEGDDEATA